MTAKRMMSYQRLNYYTYTYKYEYTKLCRYKHAGALYSPDL